MKSLIGAAAILGLFLYTVALALTVAYELGLVGFPWGH